MQWKSGIAAWLGWLFDGLDTHLYGLVASTFVASILMTQGLIPVDATLAHAEVVEKSGYIQAAFLVGWAFGGAFFGRLGDLIGRSRSLSLTILTYALFTGLTYFAQTWEQLMVYRFVAALGIGGEWAVGSALLFETWPRKWGPWLAAILQTGVNIGLLLACLTTYLMADLAPKYVFLVGTLPALLVLWIRRHVPESEVWREARQKSGGRPAGLGGLFRGPVLKITVATAVVCAFGLTGWWSFMFWHLQHLRNLPDLDITTKAEFLNATSELSQTAWAASYKQKVVSTAFALVFCASMVGNFLAAKLALLLGYRRAISICFLGMFLSMAGAFVQTRGWESLVYLWFPLIGLFSGVFGLFTMYLPLLFPTLLRTTGSGFCYNIGRVVSAAGVAFAGVLSANGDFRHTLLLTACLFVPPALIVLLLPKEAEESADGALEEQRQQEAAS